MASDISTIIINGKPDELKEQQHALNRLPVAMSYIVDPFELHQLTQLLHLAYSQTQVPPFSITLDFSGVSQDKEVPKEWSDAVCLALGHLHYQKINNRKLLLTIGFTHQCQPVLDGMLRHLSLQGYDQVTVSHQDYKTQGPDTDIQMLVITEWKNDPFNWFYQLYRKQVVHTRSPLLIIAKSTAVPVSELLQCQEQADKKLSQEESNLFYLIRELRRCTAELMHTKQDCKLISEELKSKKDYHDYLLGKVRMGNVEDYEFTDLVRLRRFYQNEYEILPLWYKQFGHLIKVIMGKRTFRSLYRDDVKKYR